MWYLKQNEGEDILKVLGNFFRGNTKVIDMRLEKGIEIGREIIRLRVGFKRAKDIEREIKRVERDFKCVYDKESSIGNDLVFKRC